MDKKKVLIICRSFYPENTPRAFRAAELAKEMCRQGHDVTLYTLKKNAYHLPLEKEFGMKIKDLGPLSLLPVKVATGSKLAVLFKRVINRALLLLVEYPDIELMFKVKQALKKESGYDLMISIAVPHPIHWGVAWAVNKKNSIATTWVGDCGDAYMGVIKHDSFGKMFYFKYLEKWFCKKADYIAIPNINMKVNYYPEFHYKIKEIPQGFKFEEALIKKAAPYNKVPVFAFAGIFMRTTRNPAPLLDYLVKSKRDFKFIIYTTTPGIVLPYKKILGDKLEILDFIPRLELIKELSNVDFLINIGFDPAQQIPSKLIDYYFTGRPTLCFATNDVDEVSLEEFLEGNYSKAFKFDNIDKFRIENVCRSFIDLCGAKELQPAMVG
jgi:hypothetical protein